MVDLAHGRLGGGAMRSSPESSPSVLRRACARRAAECSRACFIAGVVQLQQWFSGFSGACGWLWAATIAWRGSDGGGVQWRRLRGATPHLFDFFLSLSLSPADDLAFSRTTVSSMDGHLWRCAETEAAEDVPSLFSFSASEVSPPTLDI